MDEEFSKMVEDFNIQYGSLARIGEYSNYEGQEIMGLVFQANLAEVSERLRGLASSFGLEVDEYQCINKGSWENRIGLLTAVRQIAAAVFIYCQYNPERDLDTYTALGLDDSNIEQLAPLIRNYILSMKQYDAGVTLATNS